MLKEAFCEVFEMCCVLSGISIYVNNINLRCGILYENKISSSLFIFGWGMWEEVCRVELHRDFFLIFDFFLY